MAKQTLPRTARLVRKAEIDLAFRKGKRVSGPLLRVHVRPNELGMARMTVSVPKRLCPSAVKRNRWKRLLRESFRLNRAEFPAVDILAIPNRTPDELKRQDVEKALLALVKRASRRDN